MAIVATPSLPSTNRVRKVRAERLTAIALFRNRLLLRINPFAILILRTDKYCTRRPHRRVAAASNAPVTTKKKHVVAQSLKIVGSPVAQLRFTLVVQHRSLLVRLHLKM